MMKVVTCSTPGELDRADLPRRCVVVFDVIRATTTIAAGLNAGLAEIRVFDSIESARAAAAAFAGPKLLCGEVNALPPPGFDLGNSPSQFTPALHAGRTAFMSTTNGTRALVAARTAALLLTGAVVNAAAAARAATASGRDITLLCAGTHGRESLDDLLGAGAVLDALASLGLAPSDAFDDRSRRALEIFRRALPDLRGALLNTPGSENLAAAGLVHDIEACAALDRLDIVGCATGDPLTITRFS